MHLNSMVIYFFFFKKRKVPRSIPKLADVNIYDVRLSVQELTHQSPRFSFFSPFLADLVNSREP